MKIEKIKTIAIFALLIIIWFKGCNKSEIPTPPAKGTFKTDTIIEHVPIKGKTKIVKGKTVTVYKNNEINKELALENYNLQIAYINAKDSLEKEKLYNTAIELKSFNQPFENDNFKEFSAFSKRRYPTRGNITTRPEFGSYDEAGDFVPYAVNSGTIIKFFIEIKAFGNIEFNHTYSKEFIANEDYASLEEWFDVEVSGLLEWTTFANAYLLTGHRGVFSTNGETFHIRPWRDGTSSKNIYTTLKFEVAFSQGNLIFETDPVLEPNTPFFKTPETYRVIDGEHEFEDHILTRAFNCFSFGNGVESNRIRDAFNENRVPNFDTIYKIDNEYIKQLKTGVFKIA